MKFSFASLLTKLTLATSVAGALVGCDEPNYPTPTPVTESSVGQARVLVVNAAPGSQGVTTTVDGSPFGAVAPYLGTAAGTYTGVSAGQRLFLFNDPANVPSNATTSPATPRTLAARSLYLGGTNYTVFVTDVPTRPFTTPVTSTSDQGGIRTLTLTDNLAAPAVATNAKIRFVNLAPTATGGSTTYGIFNSLTQAPLFSAAPTRAFRGLSTGTGTTAVTFANFTEVAAGTYKLDVRSVAATPLVGTQQDITLVAGKIYTLYVRGIAGSSTTPLGISIVANN
ncbi:hypothetical protein BEN47_13335 [Hymenobacter lapidarius]|uniref:DUF4397 domain-containing protein n=1 Tax=Hymenobacter lapidarius TaxID=1908237 RepID=A0A1G1T5C2_9BACT|nr:DUF4397 domain-containing protein [Hymenobacter lapidarius]OGX86085.1 hypothetical protein BEN47_13335 [Hymenobacter lapidarius]